MLVWVAQRIPSDFPEVKFFTKHDSLLPTGMMITGQTSEVETMMLKVIESLSVNPIENKFDLCCFVA